MDIVGRVFTYATGKTPYVYFKDRASFPNKLTDALKENNRIVLSNLDVTFAWDKVCIFGPYTNNEKAKTILQMDWNVEDRSEIHYSDSINALVFIYQGKVNNVVDLRRGIADFRSVDLCLSREQTAFDVELDGNGIKYLRLAK
jgi:hypothetical protein